jgi:hypothetical protein
MGSEHHDEVLAVLHDSLTRSTDRSVRRVNEVARVGARRLECSIKCSLDYESKCFGGANLVMVCAHGMDVTNRSVDGIGDATPPTHPAHVSSATGHTEGVPPGNAETLMLMDGWGFWGVLGGRGRASERRTVMGGGKGSKGSGSESVTRVFLLCGSTVRSSAHEMVVFFPFYAGGPSNKYEYTSTEHTSTRITLLPGGISPSILWRRAFDAEFPGTPGAKPFGWGKLPQV